MSRLVPPKERPPFPPDDEDCRHDNCWTGEDKCDWICQDCGAWITDGKVVSVLGEPDVE